MLLLQKYCVLGPNSVLGQTDTSPFPVKGSAEVH